MWNNQGKIYYIIFVVADIKDKSLGTKGEIQWSSSLHATHFEIERLSNENR